MKRASRIVLSAFAAALVALFSAACIHPSLAPYATLEAPTKPSGLTARFLGTATLVFDDGSTALMTDGFFSRPSLWRVAFGHLEPNEPRINQALTRAQVNQLAALFVAHSHYDHAMDSATVARKSGAIVIGSESTANIARGEGLPDERIRVVKDGDPLTFGRFRVTAFETPHSPKPLYLGEIEKPLHLPARASDYREGGNYSFLIEHDGVRILVVASANYVPGRLKNVRADVVFLGIGTLGKQSDEFAESYWREVVLSTGAKRVIPIHWDDFMLPLDEPLQPLPRGFDNFGRGMELLTKLAKQDGVEVRLPKAFDVIVLDSVVK
jgi:L-ascorbate metabolism protein UlaG (beta-lactamase superfamily)